MSTLLPIVFLIFPPYQAGAIRGGKKAAEGQYTFSVALRRNGIYYCTGSIVSKNQVVTAAHCVMRANDPSFQETPLQVLIGSNNYKKRDTGLILEVQNVFVPKARSVQSMSSANIGDIAVLELERGLNLAASNILLSKLFLPESRSYDAKSGTLVGFGWNIYSGQVNPADFNAVSLGWLTAAKVEILSDFECEQYYGAAFDDSEHFCARAVASPVNSPVGACVGDNGGPLVHDGDTIKGVLINYNINCNDNEKPHLYVKVLKYNNFIKKALRSEFRPEYLANKLTVMV